MDISLQPVGNPHPNHHLVTGGTGGTGIFSLRSYKGTLVKSGFHRLLLTTADISLSKTSEIIWTNFKADDIEVLLDACCSFTAQTPEATMEAILAFITSAM